MSKITWPENSVWPKPEEANSGFQRSDPEDDLSLLDEEKVPEVGELLEIKDAWEEAKKKDATAEDKKRFREIKKRYEPDFSLFTEKGKLDENLWNELLSETALELKILNESPIEEIEKKIGYEFTNENLLRQAFTRRDFANEHHLKGCSEQLEYMGDSILGFLVTKAEATDLSKTNPEDTDAPYQCDCDEGKLSKIREKLVCKENLCKRAKELDLGSFILYGTNESESDSALEDCMEAIIGAVAIDSGWNMEDMENVVDHLVGLQMENADSLTKKDFYDILNAWHQKKYGFIPEYKIQKTGDGYECTVTGPDFVSRWKSDTKSSARSFAATFAVYDLRKRGLWIHLSDSRILPNYSDSVTQLQELCQKKYLDEMAEYIFEKREKYWNCKVVTDGYYAEGNGSNKTEAKRRAAFFILGRIFADSNLLTEEMKECIHMETEKSDSFFCNTFESR